MFEIKHEVEIMMHGSCVTEGKYGGRYKIMTPRWEASILNFRNRACEEENNHGPSLYGWKEYNLNLPKSMRL